MRRRAATAATVTASAATVTATAATATAIAATMTASANTVTATAATATEPFPATLGQARRYRELQRNPGGSGCQAE